MRIDHWPEQAKIQWFRGFLETALLSLSVPANLRLREAEIAQIAVFLVKDVPTMVEWPITHVNDARICHLRFVEGLCNEALLERIREEGLEIPYRRVPDVVRAWVGSFQTTLHHVRRSRNHPLRQPLWRVVQEIRPEFVTKVLELPKVHSTKGGR